MFRGGVEISIGVSTGEAEVFRGGVEVSIGVSIGEVEVFREGVEVSIGVEVELFVALGKKHLKKVSFFRINMNFKIDEGKESNGGERMLQ